MKTKKRPHRLAVRKAIDINYHGPFNYTTFIWKSQIITYGPYSIVPSNNRNQYDINQGDMVII